MTSSYNDTPDWLNHGVKELLANQLHAYQEVPTNLYWYSTAMAQLWHRGYERRIFPTQRNQILYQEKNLLCREVDFLPKRLGHFDRVNVFDVAETMGDSSLPIIFKFMEEDLMGLYVPVTPSSTMNEMAIATLKRFALSAGLPLFEAEMILSDIELSDFRTQLQVTQTKVDQNSVNVFLLMNSRLGNSLQPRVMLQNLYNTMNEGDYLVILQGIYRSGVEDSLIHDYKSLYTQPDTMVFSPEIATLFSSQPQYNVAWEDHREDPAVIITLAVEDQNMSLMKELNIQALETVTLFRSTRFYEQNLKSMIQGVGFSLVDIAYDQQMNNALFIVTKMS